MWKIAVGFFLAMFSVSAEPVQDLLLPQAMHVAGVVVDLDGQPIVGASIDHSGDQHLAHQTDSRGRFQFDTKAPILVVRKAGFQSEILQTQGHADARITLRRPREMRVFPTCADTGTYYGIERRWGLGFQFARTAGVRESRQGHDIDDSVRHYYIKTKEGARGITHASGPSWSFGTPMDQEVWRSIKYEETVYDYGGLTIIDARGQFSNGKQWRSLGMFGESASYTDMDEATAKLLDQFMDGACLKSSHP